MGNSPMFCCHKIMGIAYMPIFSGQGFDDVYLKKDYPRQFALNEA